MKQLEGYYEEELLNIIAHFYEESSLYGGWDIYLKKEELIYIITADCPYLELYEKDNGLMIKKVGEVSDEHKVKILLRDVEMWKEESDRLYNGLRDLFNA